MSRSFYDRMSRICFSFCNFSLRLKTKKCCLVEKVSGTPVIGDVEAVEEAGGAPSGQVELATHLDQR